jgi:hypothetical protein
MTLKQAVEYALAEVTERAAASEIPRVSRTSPG